MVTRSNSPSKVLDGLVGSGQITNGQFIYKDEFDGSNKVILAKPILKTIQVGERNKDVSKSHTAFT